MRILAVEWMRAFEVENPFGGQTPRERLTRAILVPLFVAPAKAGKHVWQVTLLTMA